MNETYKIKPLDFYKCDGDSVYRAYPIDQIEYCVWPDDQNSWCWMLKRGGFKKQCKSIEDGKAKANEHWRKRIESALIKQSD